MPRLDEDPFLTPPILTGGRPMSANKTRDWRSVRPVLHAEKCTGCMLCWKFCPEACVSVQGERPLIHLDWCKGCAICVAECPAGALTLAEEEAP
ncbi:MAG: 4Fe-4S binding protein [Elusimicrobia bacterium]|nr:4Fe-4S binding protein [Elusimicrobiota bacterium]